MSDLTARMRAAAVEYDAARAAMTPSARATERAALKRRHRAALRDMRELLAYALPGPPRVATRALGRRRGAGRPAARRTACRTSSSGSSGDDSGEPPAPPAAALVFGGAVMSARLCPACWQGELTVDHPHDGGEIVCSHGCTVDVIARAVLGTTPADGSGIVVRRAVDVPVEQVRFLVPGRVPLGAVTLLAGDPGLGKSTLTALWAAQATRGDFDGEPGAVLIANAEDAPGSVIVPRLAAAGADLESVEFFAFNDEHGERGFTIPDDVPALEMHARKVGARLVVVDPLNAHVSDRTNTHRDHGIRRALAPLSAMAERLGLAVLVVTHLNKGTGADALYRIGGSIGNVGAARSVLLFTRDPDDPDGEQGSRRAVAHIKGNWAKLAPTAIYGHEEVVVTLGQTVDTHRLAYIGESDADPRDLLHPDRDDTPTARRDRAEELLADLLGDGDWHRARAVIEAARRDGISRSTLDRAAEAAGVERERRGFPSVSFWRLPPSGVTPSDATVASSAVTPLQIPGVTGDPEVSSLQWRQTSRNDATGACGRCGGLLTTTPRGPVCFGCTRRGADR